MHSVVCSVNLCQINFLVGVWSLYSAINFFAFICCIVWIYLNPGPEAVVALFLIIAGFFRDDIYCVIGKDVFALTAKDRLIRDLHSAKYSFISREFINPMVLNDLAGWISDAGDQIVSINVYDSNESNRYYGSMTVKENGTDFPIVTCTNKTDWVCYKYIGRSFSGIHIVQLWSGGNGSGVFSNVLLVTLSLDTSLQYAGNRSVKKKRYVIKLVGTLPLGDRYDGKISYKFGFLSISACNNHELLMMKKSRVLIL